MSQGLIRADGANSDAGIGQFVPTRGRSLSRLDIDIVYNPSVTASR
jgi:hypothetical protein